MLLPLLPLLCCGKGRVTVLSWRGLEKLPRRPERLLGTRPRACALVLAPSSCTRLWLRLCRLLGRRDHFPQVWVEQLLQFTLCCEFFPSEHLLPSEPIWRSSSRRSSLLS